MGMLKKKKEKQLKLMEKMKL